MTQARPLWRGKIIFHLLNVNFAEMMKMGKRYSLGGRIDSAWGKVKEASPPVCLLVVEHATDQVQNGSRSFWDRASKMFFGHLFVLKDLKAGEASRTEILAWCLEHHFELVECDEGEEEEEDGVEDDEDEGIEEKLGRARVVEALKVVERNETKRVTTSSQAPSYASESETMTGRLTYSQG